MDSATSLTIVNTSIEYLRGYFEASLPVVFPIVIGVAVLFGAIALLKRAYHRFM